MTTRNPIIGITLGDINGIGPEVALKAIHRHKWPARYRFVLIGSIAAVEAQAHKLKLPVPDVWDPTPRLQPVWRPGRITAPAARAAHAWITAGAEAAMAGRLDGIVTAPISKEGFMRAGLDVPGHTELLARLTGAKQFAMMLLTNTLRVVLVTRHIPIRDVARSITRKNIIETARCAARSLPWLGSRNKTIAVCGLNPHAGDGGAIGREDIDIIAPAVQALRKERIAAQGPLAADTVFHHALQGRYGAVIAMYHDQGLAPFKMHAFEKGVNLTLGLPIVRTSPDHGTAYDLAGKNRANESSMVEAIALAARLATRPNPWRS